MLNQLIKLLLIFIIFAVLMIGIVRDKKMNYGRIVLYVLLPVVVCFFCLFYDTGVCYGKKGRS